MMSRTRAAPLLLLFLLCPAAAQLLTGNLKVRVIFPDGRACNTQVHIQLMSSASTTPVAEGFTNDTGMTEFANLEIGNYHLVVSGPSIEETDSGMFEVDSRKSAQYLFVTVRRARDLSQTNEVSGAPTVAASDFNIPKRAVKQFDKATDLMARQEWKKAIDQFNRALSLYPQYAAAYNNLGVAYARLGDRVGERSALQRAVSLNDHFAPALVNLAKMAIVDRDFPTAENLLDKASAINPADSHTLLLLANVELLDGHYDEAIANCRKVHSLAGFHALVHYVAARAFERKNQTSEAIAELRNFLSEDPYGPRSDAARKELSSLMRQAP